MRVDLLSMLTLAAALGSGLVAGVFFAFSSFVMNGLAGLPPAHGVAAMRSINVAAISRWFLSLFLGTAVACAWLAVSSLSRWHEPGAIYGLLGSVAYLVGAFVVTIAFNVPRNEALARQDASEAVQRWRRYVAEWTAWNHVRTLAAVVAAALLVLALFGGPCR